MALKLSSEPKRISITLSDEEHRELFDVARRSRTSVSALGHLAISQLLVLSRKGALPLLPPSTVENATSESASVGLWVPSREDYNSSRPPE